MFKFNDYIIFYFLDSYGFGNHLRKIQQTEIESVKEIALKAQACATSHWHYVGTDTTNKTFFN